MAKSALEQVSERYEQAKREYYECLGHNDRIEVQFRMKQEAFHVWGACLAILQDCRGDFVG